MICTLEVDCIFGVGLDYKVCCSRGRIGAAPGLAIRNESNTTRIKVACRGFIKGISYSVE